MTGGIQLKGLGKETADGVERLFVPGVADFRSGRRSLRPRGPTVAGWHQLGFEEVEAMAHWRLFYHFVWATKSRHPLLTPALRSHVHRYATSKGRELGAIMLALNGTDDHLHVVAALPPRMSPADFTKRLKGSSSRFVTREFDIPFSWQEGYGVFSISERDVAAVVAYVRAQQEHHRAGQLVSAWERTAIGDDRPGQANSEGEQGT
jgi:putative transposase